MKQLYKLIFPLVALVLLVQCHSGGQPFSLKADAFAAKLEQTPGAILLDVRTPGEFGSGSIKDAQNIDFNAKEFKTRIAALDKSKPYFVFCLSGGRSKDAADYMRQNGFGEVYDMKGGLLAWKDSNRTLNGETSSRDKLPMSDYKKLISGDTSVLVDFYAPWCGPCRKMEPMLHDVARENKGNVSLVRVNIDENKQLAMELGIREIPVLKIYKRGEEMWTHSGLVEKAALLQALSKVK